MKKFLIAIVCFLTGFTSYAQDCFDVQLTPTVGQCFSDAKLRITAQPKSPMPTGCTSSGNYSVELIKPSGTPSVQSLLGSPATYEFNDLQPGIYTVTVSDINTGKSVVKKITLTTTYKTMNITDLKTVAPTCSTLIDGQIQFKITSGGTGPFEVTITDESGNVLVPMQTFNRPSPATNYISIQGGVGKELRAGRAILVVHDKTNVSNYCGETVYRPIDIGEPNDPSCLEIQKLKTFFSIGANCKFKLNFAIRKKDGGYVYQPNRAAAEAYFKGKAKVEVLNRTQPVATPRFLLENFYVDDYVFQKGDIIRITIKGGKNTITETIELDNAIDIPKCPSYVGGLYHNDISVYQCGSAQYGLYMYFGHIERKVKDVINGGTIAVGVRYNNDQIKPTFIVEKETSPGVWTTITTAVWYDFGADNNSAKVNLTASGAGKYRIRYKHPDACSDLCRTVELAPPAIIDPSKALENINYAYGIYENTGAVYRYIYRRNKEVIFPITVRLTPADGRSAISFQTRLPFETETYTKTVVFPLVQT